MASMPRLLRTEAVAPVPNKGLELSGGKQRGQCSVPCASPWDRSWVSAKLVRAWWARSSNPSRWAESRSTEERLVVRAHSDQTRRSASEDCRGRCVQPGAAGLVSFASHGFSIGAFVSFALLEVGRASELGGAASVRVRCVFLPGRAVWWGDRLRRDPVTASLTPGGSD
jgi:hypothetical protein